MDLSLKTLKKLLLLICTFLYLYGIQFKGIPLSFNILLGVIGVGIGTLKLLGSNKKGIEVKVDHSTSIILIALLSVICVSILSISINSTSDLSIPKSIILNVFNFFGVYTLYLIADNIYHKVDFYIISKYLVIAAIIQMTLSLWMFFVPGSVSIVTSMLSLSDLEAATMDRLEGFRLMGFGTTFFTSGIIHSFVLLIIAIVLNTKRFNFWETFGYTMAFIIISAVGMMMARTTMVGLSLALALALYKAKFWKFLISKKFRDVFNSFLLVGLVIFIIIINLPEDILDGLTVVYKFGFEVIENYLNEGELRTGSTDMMFTLYVFPEHWKTWLIGDGYFADPLEPTFKYYMGTDIGFIRLLFYFGILGLIIFYIYEFVIIYQVYKKNKNIGLIPFIFIYLLFIVLNLKGFSDLFSLIILFYFCSIKRDQDKNKLVNN